MIVRAFTVLLVRGSGAGITFITHIFIARQLGASDSGVFFLSLTIMMAAGIVGVFGMDNAMMKYLSAPWDNRKLNRVLGIALQGLIATFFVATLTALALNLFSLELANSVFQNLSLKECIDIMAYAVIPYALLQTQSGILKATKLPSMATFLESGLAPVFFGAILIFNYAQGNSLTPLKCAYFYLASSLLSALYGTTKAYRHIGFQKNLNFVPIRSLIRNALPLVTIGLMGFIVTWVSTIILGILTSTHYVGLYNAAFRTASLVSFILMAFNGIAGQKFAAMAGVEDVRVIQKLAVRAATFMTLISTPFLLFMLLNAEFILSLFGKEFRSASSLLVIIVIGQFSNTATGSVGYLLMMSGHERSIRNILVFTAVFCVASNVILIHYFGVTGAAIATSLCLFVQNILAVTAAYKKMGILVIPGGVHIQKYLLKSKSTTC